MIEGTATPESEARDRSHTPDVARMAREVVTHLAQNGAPCAALPEDTGGNALTTVTRSCLGWMIRRLNSETVPEQIDRLEPAAAGWARAGIPIGTVLHITHQGLKKGVELLFPTVRPGHGLDTTTGMTAVVQLLDLTTSTIGRVYVRELENCAAHRTSTRTLTSALLAGRPTSAAARECGIRVSTHYHVLAVALPAHPDEYDAKLDRHVAARRTLRRLQSALATASDHQGLSLLSADGGTILLPARAYADTEIDDLVSVLSTAAQVPLTATVISAETGEIPVAARHAHELLDTVEHLGLGPGVHRLADLAMEHQITRPGIGRAFLGRQLAPLDEHPELMHTLRTYLDTERNRKRTARRLYVHPNTIDYRMQRISALTGLDISDTRTWWYLNAALITRPAPDPSHPGTPDSRNEPAHHTPAAAVAGGVHHP